MTTGGPRRPALCLAVVAAAALVVGPGLAPAAADSSPGTYIGPTYSPDPVTDHPPEPGVPSAPVAPPSAAAVDPVTGAPLQVPEAPSPTRGESQNKLWFHASAWWALMLDPTGRTVRVHELMPDHTWRPTPAVIDADTGDIGDALQEGDTVHVLNRSRDGSLHYVRLTFDPAAGEYRVAPPVTLTVRGSQSPATIARDGAGRLWVAYATAVNVILTYSDTDGATWNKLTVLEKTGTGTTPEAASLVAFDHSMGVMWSNQATGSFSFASHKDGDAPEVWWREGDALSGPLMADNHISLMRIPGTPSDTVVAAVKTSQSDQDGNPAAPLIELLVRSPDGHWAPNVVSTVADQLDDPVLQFDETTRTLYVFASSHGNIVEKHTSLDHITMSPGPGEVFVAGAGATLVDPTVTQDPVNAQSGIVVLASDTVSRTYRHAELPIAAPQPVVDPEDHTPPSPPTGLRARAMDATTVLLSWAPSVDGDHWAPGGRGSAVAKYVLLRDGKEVATATSTSVRDQPRAGKDAGADARVTYQVAAVDEAGNRSTSVPLSVVLPGTGRSRVTHAVGLGLLALAVVAGVLYAVRRGRLMRTMRAPVEPSRPETPPRALTTSGRRR